MRPHMKDIALRSWCDSSKAGRTCALLAASAQCLALERYSHSTREPDAAGASSVPGSRAAFARSVAGWPARRPRLERQGLHMDFARFRGGLQTVATRQHSMPTLRTKGSSHPSMGLPVRPLAGGPVWPPANCFSVALSAPDLHPSGLWAIWANKRGASPRVPPVPWREHAVCSKVSTSHGNAALQVAVSNGRSQSERWPHRKLPTARPAMVSDELHELDKFCNGRVPLVLKRRISPVANNLGHSRQCRSR